MATIDFGANLLGKSQVTKRNKCIPIEIVLIRNGAELVADGYSSYEVRSLVPQFLASGHVRMVVHNLNFGSVKHAVLCEGIGICARGAILTTQAFPKIARFPAGPLTLDEMALFQIPVV